MLQKQMMDLLKGYQDQIGVLSQLNSQQNNFQRPGSNRMIGKNKTDTRSSELKNFEKMLFSGNQNNNQYPDPSNVMIDLNYPSSKPYVKVSSNYEYNLDASSSLNAESKMVPLSAQKLENSYKKPPKYNQQESPPDLGGTNGSTNRRLNKELDEIEKLNMRNAEEFPGSLKGTRTLEQIPEEVEDDTLRNSSKFESMNKSNENNNPNKSLKNASNFKLDGTLLSDPKLAKGSMKIEKFENFPELPEYEGIQSSYLNSLKENNSTEKFNALYEDTFEGTGGSVGTGKIDFDELQKKLSQKILSTPVKAADQPPPAKPERKKWGKDTKPTRDDNLDQLQKEMEGIDKLLEQFDPDNKNAQLNYTPDENNDDYNDRLPVYETDPDIIKNQGFDTIKMKQIQYKPKMDSILEATYEQTQSKGSDFLSASERKLIQEELRKGPRGEE